MHCVSVDPNCGIRVEKKGGVAMYRQCRNVSASYEEFIFAARSKEGAARARNRGGLLRLTNLLQSQFFLHFSEQRNVPHLGEWNDFVRFDSRLAGDDGKLVCLVDGAAVKTK